MTSAQTSNLPRSASRAPAVSARYFVPQPSRHPLTAAIGILCMLFSLAAWLNGVPWAPLGFVVGLCWFLWVLWHWFGDAIGESEAGDYGRQVDKSFRWSMSWFIFSEVMFFSAFFGALFFARTVTLSHLGSADGHLLWPHFAAVWPNNGPADLVSRFRGISPWPIPTINTALLLSSGATLTVAHHALRADHRKRACIWLAITIALGVIFLCCQGYEYFHAYHALNLKLTSGMYGSIFFLLTGFHGFHVTLGALMLSVVLVRLIRGHFTPTHHFAFEGAAWYWHFVDVVWLALYVIVYWL